MNNSHKPQRFSTSAILRMASDTESAVEGGHFADDDELLACWSAGLLAPREVQQLIEHLATCPTCRREVSRLIKAGVIEFAHDRAPAEPFLSEFDKEDETAFGSKRDMATPLPRQEKRTWSWGRDNSIPRLAMAASLLIAISGILWLLSRGDSQLMLARAEGKLAAGDALAAVHDAEKVLARASQATMRSKAQELLERAGYQAALTELADGQYDQVIELENRVVAGAGRSARLLNLKLQAEQQIPSELALPAQGALTAYGYQLDGSSPQKALPAVNKATARVDKGFREAVKEFPHDKHLLLNRGHFLLTRHDYSEATECCTALIGKDPENWLARLGLGLAMLGQKRYQAALDEFEALLARQPDCLDAHLNAAACLWQLGRLAEARNHWRRAAELTKDPQLLERIDARLSARNS